LRTDEEMLSITRAKAAGIVQRRRRIATGGSVVVLVAIAVVAIALPGGSGKSEHLRTTRPAGQATSTSVGTSSAAVTSSSVGSPGSDGVTTTSGPSTTIPRATTTVVTTTTWPQLPTHPSLQVTVTPDAASVVVGAKVTVAVHASDDFASSYDVRFDPGDGTTPSGDPPLALMCPRSYPTDLPPRQPSTHDSSFPHTYTQAGTYTVTVTVHTYLFCDPRYVSTYTPESKTVTVSISVHPAA